MKEIVIISGKGGTGKTSVAAALASIANNIVVADCDVDAADMHLILEPAIIESEDFFSGVKAEIDQSKCSSCGLCKDVCRFGAVSSRGNLFSIEPLDCEGCGYCFQVCPVGAISLPEQKVGQVYISETKLGCRMVHARLGIGADNSGKLVARVKKDARVQAELLGADFIIVDGSPGIGCPVISSLSGADYVLLVTEPTLSGLSDLQRVWQLIAQFRIPAACVINKADINPGMSRRISEFISSQGIRLLDEIPYDEDFSRAITLGQSLPQYSPEKWLGRFDKIWSELAREVI